MTEAVFERGAKEWPGEGAHEDPDLLGVKLE